MTISRTGTLPDGSLGRAVFSDDDRHRYLLTRRTSPPDIGASFPLFLMLNPSIADHEVSDPTVTRCAGFAKRLGYNGFAVCNLFSLRATNPKELLRDDAPEGDPQNLETILRTAPGAEIVICAWGTLGELRQRNEAVLARLIDAGYGPKLRCLGETKDGHPRHPLYLASSTPLEPYGGHDGLEFDENGVAF